MSTDLHVLSELIDVLLRDLDRPGAVRPHMTTARHRQEASGAYAEVALSSADGSSYVLFIDVEGTRGQQLTALADGFQDWEVEELAHLGHSAVWPQCPTHPDTHPLNVQLIAGSARWICPRRPDQNWKVGDLPAPQT